LRQLRSIRRIVTAIDRFAPDVVHYQHGHLWFNLVLPKLKRYPLVVTIHDPRHHPGDRDSKKTPQSMLDYGYRQADRVIVHATALVTSIESTIGIPAERIHVIPHVAIGATPMPAAIEEADHEVLFFGRIWEYKGLEFLIRAEPLIAEHVSDVRIVIAGEGENFDRYRDLMVHPQRFEVHNRWIGDTERAMLFSRAAVVVLPYIEATQSGVVPVAYTFGKPVIATRVGGLPECVEHEETGLLVPPRDENAIAKAVVRLLCDAPLRHRLGVNGHRKLLAEASAEVVAEQNVAVYQQAVADFHLRTLCTVEV
jgi:glycosyltransferase involved in cell wall biosynthesis